MAKNDELFYVGQKVLVEKDGKVLVLQVPNLGADFPGGKVQKGETDFAASLQREVAEETGIQVEIGEPFLTGYFKYSSQESWRLKDTSVTKVFVVVYKGTYLSGDVNLSREHDSYEWVTKESYEQSSATLEAADPIKRALEKYFSS